MSANSFVKNLKTPWAPAEKLKVAGKICHLPEVEKF